MSDLAFYVSLFLIGVWFLDMCRRYRADMKKFRAAMTDPENRGLTVEQVGNKIFYGKNPKHD